MARRPVVGLADPTTCPKLTIEQRSIRVAAIRAETRGPTRVPSADRGIVAVP